MNNMRQRVMSLLILSGILLCSSVLLAVLALRSLPLTELVSFAAVAYVLVPLGSHVFFHEKLTLRFAIGAIFIILGIMWIHV